MSSPAISGFLQSPYYKMSDVKMLHFFTQMSILTMVVLTVLVLSSVVIRNVWCRYLCPYGALMGLLAAISPTRIQRNPDYLHRLPEMLGNMSLSSFGGYKAAISSVRNATDAWNVHWSVGSKIRWS